MTQSTFCPYSRPQLFFLHIPKTAGMTLRMLLGNQYSVDEILSASGWAELVNVNDEHLKEYKLVQGHFTPGMLQLLPAGTKSMVFLREPVARTVSHLKHLRRDPNFHPAHHLAVGRSLADLVRDERIMSLCSNVQAAILSNDIPGDVILRGVHRSHEEDRPFDPGIFETGSDFSKAVNTLSRFDFVGFVEEFHNDVLRLSMEFGFHPPDLVPKRNYDPDQASDGSELDPETLSRLRTRNAVDIAVYNHAREKFTTNQNLSREMVMRSLVSRGVYSPIAAPTKIAMTGPIPGSNWYEVEEPKTGGLRWTGPLTETTLDLALAPNLDFEVSLYILLPNLGDLTVEIDDERLPVWCHSSEDPMHRISVWVPARMVHPGGLTTLRFRTRTAPQGSETDIRRLSFMVRELAIFTVV